MYVVALVEMEGTIEAESTALGADLGVTAYEIRLTLAQGTPSIVLSTPDEFRALELLARLRARGHGAVMFDAASVVPSQATVSMRRFRLGDDAIHVDDRADELPYADIGALIAAVHRRQTTTESETRDRQLSVGRAVLTGGLVMTKTVTRETRTETNERDPVLYVFRRSGGAPWLLRECGTLWVGHGQPISPLSAVNFKTTVDKVREFAPNAIYDDRLVTRRGAPERLSGPAATGGPVTRSSEAAMDLYAHVLGAWSMRANATAPSGGRRSRA